MVSGLETKLEGPDSNPGRVISLYFWTRCLIYISLLCPRVSVGIRKLLRNFDEFVDLAEFHSED